MNPGFGSEYYFDRRLSGFGEIKYVTGDADQAVFTFGVLYLPNS
ncbi:MAG: UTP20 family protein [Cytophagales bacterium]|nr:UTP20 family protein [Cytophagales bacterium]